MMIKDNDAIPGLCHSWAKIAPVSRNPIFDGWPQCATTWHPMHEYCICKKFCLRMVNSLSRLESSSQFFSVFLLLGITFWKNECTEPRLLWFLRNVLGWLKWPNCSKNLAPPPPRLPPKAGSFNVLFRESRRHGVVPARWLCSKDSLVAKGSLAMTLFVLFNSCWRRKIRCLEVGI